MDNYPLPVFNIESEDEENEDGTETKETKQVKCEHLHKLLSKRSIYSPSNNPNSVLKKLEIIAEDNLLKKDLREVVS